MAKKKAKKRIKKKKTVKKSKNQAKKKEKKTKVEKVKLAEDKQEVIEQFALKEGDTGSPDVQVALLAHKIQRLTNHLDNNPKDDHSRRGLLKMIAKRRRILNYLENKDAKRYKGLIKRLGLKK